MKGEGWGNHKPGYGANNVEDCRTLGDQGLEHWVCGRMESQTRTGTRTLDPETLGTTLPVQSLRLLMKQFARRRIRARPRIAVGAGVTTDLANPTRRESLAMGAGQSSAPSLAIPGFGVDMGELQAHGLERKPR